MANKVTHEVDFELMHALIDSARGNRSYSQYSRDCGFRRELVSKILRKEYYPGLEVVLKLAEGSTSVEATYGDFMVAAGYGELYSKIKRAVLISLI